MNSTTAPAAQSPSAAQRGRHGPPPPPPPPAAQTPAAAQRGRHADSPWQMPLTAWKEVAVRTWRESSKDNVGIVAAGVAFYGFLALVPMLGATVLTYGMAGGHTRRTAH